MKTVIKDLKKQLREWKQWYASEKKYFKGHEEDVNATEVLKNVSSTLKN